MRILYAVGSWGLGHATRSLPLIAGLLDAGATLTVASTGRVLLRAELGRRCDVLDWPDVPQPIGRGAAEFHARAAAAIPWFLRSMAHGLRFLSPSTVMEPAEVERRAVLIPTPGQTGQEHRRHQDRRGGAPQRGAHHGRLMAVV